MILDEHMRILGQGDTDDVVRFVEQRATNQYHMLGSGHAEGLRLPWAPQGQRRLTNGRFATPTTERTQVPPIKLPSQRLHGATEAAAVSAQRGAYEFSRIIEPAKARLTIIDRPAGLTDEQWAAYMRTRSKDIKPPATDTYDIDPMQKARVLSARLHGETPPITADTQAVIDKMKLTEVAFDIDEAAPLVRTLGFSDDLPARFWGLRAPVGKSIDVDLPESFSFSPEWSGRFGLKDLNPHQPRDIAAQSTGERVILRIHGRGKFSPSYGNEVEQELRLMPGQKLRIINRKTVVEDLDIDTFQGRWQGYMRQTYIDAVIEQADEAAAAVAAKKAKLVVGWKENSLGTGLRANVQTTLQDGTTAHISMSVSQRGRKFTGSYYVTPEGGKQIAVNVKPDTGTAFATIDDAKKALEEAVDQFLKG